MKFFTIIEANNMGFLIKWLIMVVFSSFKTAELKYEHHGVVIGAGFGDQ